MNKQHILLAAAVGLFAGSVGAQTADPSSLCDGWYCALGSVGKPAQADTPVNGALTPVEPGNGSDSAVGSPIDTEATVLDYLKKDPNYANLFVKEPTTSANTANPCNVMSCIGSGLGAPPGPAPGTPIAVTDENALDFLKNNPAYSALLKDPDFMGADSSSASSTGEPSPMPSAGLSGPNCVSYFDYVCNKDFPSAKDNTSKDEDQKTPEEQSSTAANSMADFLTGDAKDACEALLCLSSSDRPGECDPPIARYLSIVKRTAAKTAQARADFLKLCPLTK
jgi:hypothetical protein